MNMDPTTTFLINVALRSAVLLGAVLVAAAIMYRRSAAERHLILTLGMALALVLPVGLLAMPAWKIVIWPAARGAATEIHQSPPAQVGANLPGSRWQTAVTTIQGTDHLRPGCILLTVFILGAMVQCMRLGAAGWRLDRVRRRARAYLAGAEFTDELGAISVVLSNETRIAFVTGWLHPVIVLPASATSWSRGHLRMVLYHEVGHVRRGDHWIQALCCVARVLYWWQPLIWLVLAHLQRERELACDDSVIGRFRASDYAELLLTVAGEAKERSWPAGALAMAATSNFEARIRAILDGSRSRNSPGGRACGLFSAAALAGALLMCSMRLGTAETQPANPPSSPEDAKAKPTSKTESEYIEIESKFLEISDDLYQQCKPTLDAAIEPVDSKTFNDILKTLDNLKGADFMSAPGVTTRHNHAADVVIAREFRYPTKFEADAGGHMVPTEFATRNLGVQLVVEPTLSNGKIWLTGSYQLTDFAGFTRSEAGEQTPAFDVREARLLRELGDGQWVCIVLPGERPDEEHVSDRQPDGHLKESTRWVGKKMILFLGARVVEKTNSAEAGNRGAKKSLPYGVPVPNKPGFIASPYAPYSRAVDVRGFPSNSPVKCPYTGKIFLVP